MYVHCMHAREHTHARMQANVYACVQMRGHARMLQHAHEARVMLPGVGRFPRSGPVRAILEVLGGRSPRNA